MQGVFGCSGQVCVATKRKIVDHDIHIKFLDAFSKFVNILKVGNPIDRTVNIGPVINSASLSKIEYLVNNALDMGADIVTGGKRLYLEECKSGFFYFSNFLNTVNPEMEIAKKRFSAQRPP